MIFELCVWVWLIFFMVLLFDMCIIIIGMLIIFVRESV